VIPATQKADDYLQHHGILGQKWGVRRYQNYDGTLTTAGKKRYDVDTEGAKEKIETAKKNLKRAKTDYNIATAYGTIPNAEATASLVKAQDSKKWAEQQLHSEKIKEKLNSETGEKSKRRLKLEQSYREKGMSQEEAEIAAYQRVRTEKILATAAGLTVAAATALVAYKHYDKTVDKIIKAGGDI
jgi:hypothetical protein